MGYAHVIEPEEREWFRRCRRAWDFASPNRRNLEPEAGSGGAGLERAVRMAMAVWYFPGMWEWPRAIVLPRALQAFDEATAGGSASPEAAHAGRAMLERYFAWAPAVDAFAPVRVEADFEAGMPDPRTPGEELVAPDGRPVRYHDRVHLLIVDPNDAYWVVEHRLAADGWADLDELLLAERPLTAAWGWEQFYLGMEFAGTVHNELRATGRQGDEGPGGRAPARHPRSRDWARARAAGRKASVQHEVVVQEGGGWFRRSWIRRTRMEVTGVGQRLSAEASEMLDPTLALYPTPRSDNCGRCDYRAPCLALNRGEDPAPVLQEGYRLRPQDRIEEGRLGGGSWSMNRGAAPPPAWRPPPD